MKNDKPFIISHVLVIKGPPDYIKETEPYHLKLYKVNELPEGFTIKPTYGDAFLKYKDDGTIRTACSRNFFQKTGRGWKRWPYHDNKSPKDVIKDHGD